ncbi:hypothetical protein KR200_000657, partial [Drosophila serrata]
MAAFLEKRCRMMENIENAMVTHTPSNQVGKTINKNVQNACTASSYTSLCILCDSKDHFISKCPQFIALSPTLRYKEAKRLHLCLNCLRKGHSLQQCKAGNCRHCRSKHHTLLHLESNPASSPSQPTSTSAPQNSASLISASPNSPPPKASVDHQSDYVLLATAIIYVRNRSGIMVPCRALLDSASQINFITSRLAHQLQLSTRRSNTCISGIGESSLMADKAVDIIVQSRNKGYRTSFAAIMTSTITNYQPHFDLNSSEWNIPSNLFLADPLFHKSQRIDILIGAGIFFDLLCVGQIRLADHLPSLQKTRLGWVVSGGISSPAHKHSSLPALSVEHDVQLEPESLPDLVKRFWEIDSYCGSSSAPTDEDALCENLFAQSYSRLESGQYSVRLPAKTSLDMLGDSYHRASQRFKSLESKLARNPNLKAQYIAFIKEYIDLGHMSLSCKQSALPQYYLPHHCVHKLDSSTTKLRVVFDGSAKSSSGYSLNELLFAGPSIQPKIFSTLVRFRFFKVALCGDICKMYRCVRVSEPDNLLQCILWRDSPSEEIKIYTLDTVTYGTKPAAFLAIRAMQQLSYDEEKDFPVAA